MRRKLRVYFYTIVIVLFAHLQISNACTNFLISKGASVDGSTMITYAADAHVLIWRIVLQAGGRLSRRNNA